jgi:hypothetical protein
VALRFPLGLGKAARAALASFGQTLPAAKGPPGAIAELTEGFCGTPAGWPGRTQACCCGDVLAVSPEQVAMAARRLDVNALEGNQAHGRKAV